MDESLAVRAEAFWTDYLRAEYRAWAGLDPDPELAAACARHEALFADDALPELERREGEAEGTEALRLRHLREFLLWARADRAGAELLDRRLAWEAEKQLRVDEAAIPFRRVNIELANEEDNGARWAVSDAWLAALREAEPLDRQRFEAEWRAFEEGGGGGGYLQVWESATGIALDPLVAGARVVLGETEDLYFELLAYELGKRLGLEPHQARLADTRRLERAPWLDGVFGAREPLQAARRQHEEQGVDLLAGGRIRLDLQDRPTKRARAFCTPIRVPHEIVLVLAPAGGWRDWLNFFHELGHARHFALARAELPFELRALGDISVTETYARLFHRLTADPHWLERYLGLRGAERADFLRLATFVDLFHLRRQAAKLLYEIELHGERSFAGMPERYSDRLTEATGVRHGREAYLDDVDPRLYCTRYLRAYQLEALLAERLRDEFDEDWFRNPRAAPFLNELFELGQSENADALAARLGGELSFERVRRRLEEVQI